MFDEEYDALADDEAGFLLETPDGLTFYDYETETFVLTLTDRD
jgi:hypothetical protein